MEREEFDIKLKEFLEKNGYSKDTLSNKDKIRILSNIAMISENDMILLEQDYTTKKDMDQEHIIKTEEDIKKIEKIQITPEIDDYIKTIHNLEVNVHNANYYINGVKSIIKLERKEKLKQKVKSLFRK